MGNYFIEKGILYLGTTLNANNSNDHVNKRIKSARRQAFYSLQSAGLKYQGVSPETAMTVFDTAVESTLVYGCTSPDKFGVLYHMVTYRIPWFHKQN